jgi:hypothetical protein
VRAVSHAAPNGMQTRHDCTPVLPPRLLMLAWEGELCGLTFGLLCFRSQRGSEASASQPLSGVSQRESNIDQQPPQQRYNRLAGLKTELEKAKQRSSRLRPDCEGCKPACCVIA